MKIIMYGTPICGDCAHDKSILEKQKGIELDYRNITESTSVLKEFLSYRDNEAIFNKIIENNGIGIPFYILEDDTKTLDIFDYLDIEKPKIQNSSCSLDGSGNC